MHPLPQSRRAKRSLPSDRGNLLRDAASFAALAVFVAAVVWFAATAGELVALWRLGGGP
jgi:hypothetical protein